MIPSHLPRFYKTFESKGTLKRNELYDIESLIPPANDLLPVNIRDFIN